MSALQRETDLSSVKVEDVHLFNNMQPCCGATMCCLSGTFMGSRRKTPDVHAHVHTYIHTCMHGGTGGQMLKADALQTPLQSAQVTTAHRSTAVPLCRCMHGPGSSLQSKQVDQDT